MKHKGAACQNNRGTYQRWKRAFITKLKGASLKFDSGHSLKMKRGTYKNKMTHLSEI